MDKEGEEKRYKIQDALNPRHYVIPVRNTRFLFRSKISSSLRTDRINIGKKFVSFVSSDGGTR